MAVIYLKHPVHGTKVASSTLEADVDEANGWEKFDPSVFTLKPDPPKDPRLEPVEVPRVPVAEVPPVPEPPAAPDWLAPAPKKTRSKK